ncbi:MAG: NAD-dependent epimerase/dehydratase family protein [Planctomycetes bacterium]|nr:NAD-dependent epimerase/dehydratase family protein [Planctomycetota bacterium]
MAYPKKVEPGKSDKKKSNGKRVSESKRDEPKPLVQPAVEPAATIAPQHSEDPVDSISASKAQSESPQPSNSSLKPQVSSLKPQPVVARRAVEKKKKPAKEKKREKPDRPGFFRRLANRFTVEEIDPLPDVTKPELPEKTSTEPIIVEVKPAAAPDRRNVSSSDRSDLTAIHVESPQVSSPRPRIVVSVSTPPPKPAQVRTAEPLNLKDDLLPAPGESIGTWKILVTGGGGFLGKAIIEQLHARGLKVRSFSRSDYHELRRFGTEHFRGDLANTDALKKAIDGCDIVFHTAALAGVWGPESAYHKANVVGTQNVINACCAAGVKRLIYTSSPSVVFDGSDMQGIDESAPYPTHYDAAYPKSKALAEQLVLAANSPRLATVSLRPHLIWGPGDHHLVPRILARARSLRIIGGANKMVDSVYIDNAADAHLLAAGRLRPDSPIAGKAYFITNGEPRPMWDLVNGILAAGKLPPVTRGVSRGKAFAAAACMEFFYSLFGIEGEPRLTRFVARELTTAHWFDITAARRDLNYSPHVTLDEGLSRLAAWLSSGGAKMLRAAR